MPGDVGRGKRTSDGAAQFSRSENGDGLHRYGIVYVGSLHATDDSPPRQGRHRHRRFARDRPRGGGRPARRWRVRGASPARTTRGWKTRVTCCPRRDPGMADRLMLSRTDVRREGDVDALMSAAIRRFGGIDILINNAGVGGFAEVAAMTRRRVAPRDRHEPHRRVPLLPRGDSAPQVAWRRLDHQRQQPCREESLRRRRRLLRLEGRTRTRSAKR